MSDSLPPPSSSPKPSPDKVSLQSAVNALTQTRAPLAPIPTNAAGPRPVLRSNGVVVGEPLAAASPRSAIAVADGDATAEKADASRSGVKWYKRGLVIGMAVKPTLVMNFSRQLASFLDAGIPITEGLAITAEENSDGQMGEVIESIRTSLSSGRSFGAAVAQHPKVFPGYFISMVRSAELTGRLDEVLDQLADDMDRDIAARRQIKSALTYPIFVLGLALVAVVVMAVFVLPKFEGLYKSLGADLPLVTRMLLGVTDFFQNFWWAIVAFAGLAVFAGWGLFGGKHGKARKDALLLKLPVIGPLVHLIAVERFCRVLAALASAGVSLPEAVDVASRSTNNSVFITKLGEAMEAMIHGGGLAKPLNGTGLFPLAARQMIRVGESTGTLDNQLRRAATFYGRDLSLRLKRTTDLFEPIIITVVGFIVAFVAIAQVSAMYSVFREVR